MFTIKAERANSAPLAEYAIWQAAFIDVRNNQANGVNAPGQPPFVAADYSISLFSEPPLYDASDLIAQIDVGHGNNHFSVVYVINEKGRTVQTIRALNHA